MVYGIIKQNHGFINIDSDPGQGTTVKVFLPSHEGQITPVPAEIPAESSAGGTETILLVEDQENLLQLGQIMLERQGYHVLTAATPQAAIELAANYPDRIDLLISDVIMPQMDDLAMSRQLEQHCPGLKRLFMSGYTDNVIAPDGVPLPGVHFLAKPFTGGALAAKVREVLGSSSG